jgi:superfamily II DNA or RNA helicase
MDSIPFVVDNQRYKMGDTLNKLLQEYRGKSLDIASAYFNVGGWQVLAEGLCALGSVRLLLGDEPEAGADIGLREVGSKPVKGLIRDLSDASFDEKTLRAVEDLTAFLRQDNVEVRLYTKGFLHAKCYLFYSGGGFEHFHPMVAIVGSSNFTRAGLLSNKELNLVHRANLQAEETSPERLRGLLEPGERRRLGQLHPADRLVAANVPGVLAINELAEWYDQQWEDARDFKEGLLDLLDASKFGRKTYTPYQVYMKAIYEYFRDDLDAEDDAGGQGRSAVELSEFQEDAVKKARRLLARYGGVMIADSVGLGKTWIGKKLLEDYAYHLRYHAVVVCPAALQRMWQDELRSAGIAATIVTQEALGREGFEVGELFAADVLLVDECHNFRNRATQRYENLERILAAHNRKGRLSEQRKKLILLTATPISNNVFDLYNQLNLLTGGDRTYFAAAGIGDLQRYFLAARRQVRQQESGIALFNVLEEIVIRRTRPFIKQAYPNATIKGQPIHWPERALKTVHYNLEATYGGIYDAIVSRIGDLTLAPYRLELYKKKDVPHDQFVEGREEALVGIFKSRYLKRLESSIEAFRISVRRALEFLETFESYILDGKIMDSGSFQKAMRFLAREDEEDDATPGSRSDELDTKVEAQDFLASLPTLDATLYDLKRLHNDLRKDVEALRAVWQDILTLTPERDAKLNQLQHLLLHELKGQKVLIFTSYKDTARYLWLQVRQTWAAEGMRLAHMDSSTDTRERAKILARFAPRANKREELVGSSDELDVLISTDVLSEGQNLQDCGVLINYDLHWNPTRMIQRAGRIDRLGTDFQRLWIMNMFPDDGLEKLLGLVESLSQKIADIDRNGLLDASILGEAVHPQNFNTLRRIAAEDGRVLMEQEHFSELVSSEFLLQNLKGLLNNGMRQSLEELPDGIHSGLGHQGAKGVFFAFTAPDKSSAVSLPGSKPGRKHYWRYVDLFTDEQGGRIEENRYILTNLIHCHPDTMRVVPLDGTVDIFALQEKVIASILQASIEQRAIAEAPKLLDPIQQAVKVTLRNYIHSPLVSRQEIVQALQCLKGPLPGVYLKILRKAYEAFLLDSQIRDLLVAVQNLGASMQATASEGDSQDSQNAQAVQSRGRKELLRREDLRLVCFDYIWH